MGGCTGKSVRQSIKQIPDKDKSQQDMEQYYEYAYQQSQDGILSEVNTLLCKNDANQTELQGTKDKIKQQYDKLKHRYITKNQTTQLKIDSIEKKCEVYDDSQDQHDIKLFKVIFQEDCLKGLVHQYEQFYRRFLQFLKDSKFQQNILDVISKQITSQQTQRDKKKVDQGQQEKINEYFTNQLQAFINQFYDSEIKTQINNQTMIEQILLSKLSKSNDEDFQCLVKMIENQQNEQKFLNFINQLFPSNQNYEQPSTCPRIPLSKHEVIDTRQISVNCFPSQKLSVLINQFDKKYDYKQAQQDQQDSQQKNNDIDNHQKLNPSGDSSSKLINNLSTKYSYSTIQNGQPNQQTSKQETQQYAQQSSTSSQLINNLAGKYSFPNLQNEDLQQPNEQKNGNDDKKQPHHTSSQLIQMMEEKYTFNNLKNNKQIQDHQNNIKKNPTTSTLVMDQKFGFDLNKQSLVHQNSFGQNTLNSRVLENSTFANSQLAKELGQKDKTTGSNQNSELKSSNNQTANFQPNQFEGDQSPFGQRVFSKFIPASVLQTDQQHQPGSFCQPNFKQQSIKKNETASQLLQDLNNIDDNNNQMNSIQKYQQQNQQLFNPQKVISFLGSALESSS